MKRKKDVSSSNNKAIFQLISGFLFIILFIFTFAVEPTPNTYGLLMFSMFFIVTAVIRIFYKIPLRGTGNVTSWATFGNMVSLFLGSIFTILGVCAIIY